MEPLRAKEARERQIVELLAEIRDLLKGAPPPTPPVVVPPPAMGAVELGDASIQKLSELVDKLATILEKLPKIPNRIEKIEVDTSKTTQASLKKDGKIKTPVALGFEVEDVGGGFKYVIVKEGFGKDERTAITGDKFDIEFDDLLVTGLGNAGTAVIWYWWKET